MSVGFKPGEQLPALVRLIEIEHRHPDVMQFESRRIAIDHDLQNRWHDQSEARVRITKQLDELLDQHLSQPCQHVLLATEPCGTNAARALREWRRTRSARKGGAAAAPARYL